MRNSKCRNLPVDPPRKGEGDGGEAGTGSLTICVTRSARARHEGVVPRPWSGRPICRLLRIAESLESLKKHGESLGPAAESLENLGESLEFAGYVWEIAGNPCSGLRRCRDGSSCHESPGGRRVRVGKQSRATPPVPPC